MRGRGNFTGGRVCKRDFGGNSFFSVILGATPMAAFQICLQVWLTSSLLADGLVVAEQVDVCFVLWFKWQTIYQNQMVSRNL
ncbi:hypothetical protein HanRHA438_Chr04g0183551 [Helianthus annuus]|nr:hypothetical protein HanRHA438_Chr04g0183551 [Helianthus annuus]